ncbi:MAG: hypothetical protein IKW03_02045 [Clostridia bacterium]|nr:hypothetical protein [Clostridia bacterium]
MKKLISIFLALMIMFTLSACGEKNEPEGHNHNIIEEGQTEEDNKEVKGMIYAVSGADKESLLSTEFSCNGGVITPERISAGLSGWTGLKFRISSSTDETTKTITIDWLSDASIIADAVPDTVRESFTFASVKELQVFMLNSLCYSIQANLGKEYDVFYTVNGEDIGSLGIEGLSSATAFNKTDSEFVFVK